MMNDTLSTALSKIMNAERIGKRECSITPSSKVIKNVLAVMNQGGYIGANENRDAHSILVHLLGNINKCGSIKPRFSTTLDEYEKWEKRYLPAKGFGILIVSTPKGIMGHEEAKKQSLGGKLIAYCY